MEALETSHDSCTRQAAPMQRSQHIGSEPAACTATPLTSAETQLPLVIRGAEEQAVATKPCPGSAEQQIDSSVTPIPETQLFDLPPELTEAIWQFAILDRDYQLITGGLKDKALSPSISRVSRRLRQESLAQFYTLTRFAIFIPELGDFDRGLYELSQRWINAVGAWKLSHLSFLTLESERPLGVYWLCDMDFQKGRLEMMDRSFPDMSKVRWCLKKAFEHTTQKLPWQPTLEGLRFLIRVFAISFREDQQRGAGSQEANRRHTDNLKI